jgi:TfoX/Sxy family transcriptional regulator of competence genes
MTNEELFEAIAAKLLNDDAISRKKMFGSTGLSIGGKVFALLVKGKLVVKLPRQRVEALVLAEIGQPFDPGHGRLMKEWVAIEPAAGGEWLNLAQEARDFVADAKAGSLSETL